jgi:hypothetical protein
LMLANPICCHSGWRQRMQFDHLKRREFIALVSGAAVAWPLTVRAQQPAMPVVGFLTNRSPGESAHLVAAFHQGLGETVMSTARTFRSSSAGVRGNLLGCQRWPRT